MVRNIGLDLIRCYAITLLLLAHIGQTINHPIGNFIGIPGFYFVSLGGVAVTIFLILSGAALELQYGGKNISYFCFMLKRCLRIYPVYYFSLLLGISLYLFRSYNETGCYLANSLTLNIKDIILSITGLYAFWGEWGGPFVETSWFIGLIMSMYILFPFLSQQIKKQPVASIGFLFLISLISRVILGKYEILPMRPLDWFPLCRIFEFSLGIYISNSLSILSFNSLPSSKLLKSLIAFISNISFPLFLIHYPLLFIISGLTKSGVNHLLAICYFLVISIVLSWIALSIDKRFPRSLILKKTDCIP